MTHSWQRYCMFSEPAFLRPLGFQSYHCFLSARKTFTSPMSLHTHFEKVYETIRNLSICNLYYSINLFNIEDILSVLEMDSSVAGDVEAERHFVRYICDVVSGYTPPLAEPTDGEHWSKTIFGPEPWNLYGCFVASVLGHAFVKVLDRRQINSIDYEPALAPEVENQYT